MAASLQTNGTGSVSSNSQVTSLNVPIGSGIQLGDLIFIVAAWNATAPGTTYTTPSGYTAVSATTDSGPSLLASVGTWYKIADGTEASTTVTVTHSVTGRCAVVSAAFTGVSGSFDGTFPTVTFDNGFAGGQTSEASPTLTGLTNAADIAILLMGAKQGTASSTAVTFTQPAGYTSAIQASGTSAAGNNGAAAIAYKVKTDTTDETSPGWTTNLAVHWLSASVAATPTGVVTVPDVFTARSTAKARV